MDSRNRLELLLFTLAVGLSRSVFRSHDLYDVDSVNFALAIGRFDPRVHQPHPPGYFLYVCLGRWLNALLHDANLTLVVLSILASCGLVILIYQVTLEWFGPQAARFAGILFLFSPLAWFQGTVALIYCVEAFFSALLGYMCWRIERGEEAFIVPTGILLGLSAGFRPSSLLFLGPLVGFSQRNAPWRKRFAAAAALVLALAAWFLPMLSASGGARAYLGALFSLWRLVPSQGTVFNSSPANSIARACTIAFIYLLCFGAASLAPLGARYSIVPVEPRKKIFTIVWVSPALCFFTFIFLKFVNSGYLLLLSAPACIWLGFWASAWFQDCAWRKPWKLGLIGACAALNVLIFLFSPLYCSYGSVRRFQAQLDSIRAALPQLGSADQTLIIGFDSHFLGYRHAGYYLPGYLTIEYPEVELGEGTRVFAMQQRDTRLLTGLPVGSYSRFVLFPLPGGDAQQYLQKVVTKLPVEGVRKLRVGGCDFVTGPISDLPLLFPKLAPGPRPGVYALLHSAMPVVNRSAHQPPPNRP